MVHDFVAPPREMLHFSIDAAIHHPLLVAAGQVARSLEGHTPYDFYLDSYIGNLLDCLEFIIERTRDNMIQANPVRGCLLVRIEAIIPWQAFPQDGVNDWALLQREDALSGEGGVMSYA